MTRGAGGGEILTLEPLLETVREALEETGWRLSGLQKTTSYEFAGPWAGESTRSAYLFFHRPGGPEEVSIDVFVDETSRGLRGNLALVLEGPDLPEAGDVDGLLSRLRAAARDALPSAGRAPLSLRLSVPDARREGGPVAREARFRVELPRAAIRAGAPAVRSLCLSAVGSFEELLRDARLTRWMAGGGGGR